MPADDLHELLDSDALIVKLMAVDDDPRSATGRTLAAFHELLDRMRPHVPTPPDAEGDGPGGTYVLEDWLDHANRKAGLWLDVGFLVGAAVATAELQGRRQLQSHDLAHLVHVAQQRTAPPDPADDATEPGSTAVIVDRG